MNTADNEFRMAGRFGHHPIPADDFCIEIDVIEGMVADYRAGLTSRETVIGRIFRASQFRVGGDAHAVAAKERLRALSVSI